MRHSRVILSERPTGPITDTTFQLLSEDRSPDPAAGEVTVRTLWLGFDPGQRGYLNDLPSYRPPVGIGEVMRSRAIGEVTHSAHPDYETGQLVMAELGWQDWTKGTPEELELELISSDIERPTMMLGVLGTTGLTAYFGMTEIGKVQDGDTVLVTAAAGATGSIAGQIARIHGAGRVIGTAGSEEKRAWVTEVAGFDECIEHYESGVFRRIRAAAPDGFNVIYDNVGGELLDATLGSLAIGARVVLCGAISTGYAPKRAEVGLRNYQFLTTRRSRAEGFLVFDYQDRYDEARRDLQRWINEGKIHWQEDVVEGLENAPQTLQRLFDGKNLGKQILQVAEPA